MRNLLILMLFISFLGSVIAYNEKDMKYHGQPTYWWEIKVSGSAEACFFKPSDFGIKGYDYKIKIIGFIGYEENGPADIYVTSKERWNGHFYEPQCNPDNNWQGKDYGPKSWHINNSYPNYDDCNVYDDNWHYCKDVNKFWCIYHMKTKSPPYPYSDSPGDPDNTLTWDPTDHCWWGGIKGWPYDWCMHCVIVYWGAGVESTSIGVVRSLFK